jgi:hypothetical protein
MLIQENRKRRIVRFKNQTDKIITKNKILNSFEEHLDIIRKEMLCLFQRNYLSKDIKFLRKMAINIKQLHFDAKNAKKTAEWKHQATDIEHFLSTPIGAPFVSAITLTQAADNFSEQNPKESDLSILLEDFGKYGQHYATQLLRGLLSKKRYP